MRHRAQLQIAFQEHGTRTGTKSAFEKRPRPIDNDFRRIEIVFRAEAVARRARSIGRIEAERARLELRHGNAALAAGHFFREDLLRPAHYDDGDESLASLSAVAIDCSSRSTIAAPRQTQESQHRVLIDRLCETGNRGRLEQSIATALKLAKGLVTVVVVGGTEQVFSEKWPAASAAFPCAARARSFSFNLPMERARRATASARNTISIRQSHCRLDAASFRRRTWSRSGSVFLKTQSGAGRDGAWIRPRTPFEKLPRQTQNLILYGNPPSNAKDNGGDSTRAAGAKAARKTLPGLHFQVWSGFSKRTSRNRVLTPIANGSRSTCPVACAVCGEQRLRPESLAVKVGGRSIAEFTGLAISDARPAVDGIRKGLTERQMDIAGRALAEIAARLDSFCRRSRLPQSGSLRRNAFRRRGAAHSPGDADRLAAARRAVRAGRAFDRPARAATTTA